MRKVIIAATLSVSLAGAALAQRGPVTPNPDISLPPFAPSQAQVTFGAACASCHGAALTGGSAPSLFNDAFLASHNEDALVAAIADGRPGMPAFRGQLSDALMHQLTYYMRITAGRLNAKRITPPDPNGMVVKSQKQNFKLEVLTAGLDVPWGMVFLPDGRILVTERPGRLRYLDHGKLSDPIRNTPQVFVRQDGGMLDVALHPDYKKNGWIYLSYTDVRPGVTPAPGSNRAPVPAPPTMTVLVRGHIKNGEWVDNQEIFRAPPELYSQASDHYGSRFLFDKHGDLFWTLGERHFFHNAQNLAVPMGKIHRVTDDGKPAPGNPFLHTPGADPTVWSYGHRNPEGLAFNPVDGHLWETEHGPTGGDEVNVIMGGKNYGWGVISRGLEPGINEIAHDGMEQPKTFFDPAIGPGGISFYTGKKYPNWKNNLFITGMVGQKLIRMEVKDDKILSQETLLDQVGRVRDVVQGPDGLLYILLQNPTGTPVSTGIAAGDAGMVVRLVPVKG